MSNVETKRIRHTKYVQFMLEVEELIRNGWSFVPAGSTNFGVQLIANFQRSVNQDVKTADAPVEPKTESEVVVEKTTPVKAQVKPTAQKAATKKD